MKIYLDNCMFNRPFDDQSHIRIRLETEAKLYIQDKIKAKQIDLVWSYILEFENFHNPHEERKSTIFKWKKLALIDIEESHELLNHAKNCMNLGIKSKDALHIASAIVAKAEYFLTTDDKLLSAVNKYKIMKASNPINFIKVLEHDNTNN